MRIITRVRFAPETGHRLDRSRTARFRHKRPFAASGYSGSDPVADSSLQIQSDSAGGTRVLFDPEGPASGNPWPITLTTLDHVQPTGIHTGDRLI